MVGVHSRNFIKIGSHASILVVVPSMQTPRASEIPSLHNLVYGPVPDDKLNSDGPPSFNVYLICPDANETNNHAVVDQLTIERELNTPEEKDKCKVGPNMPIKIIFDYDLASEHRLKHYNIPETFTVQEENSKTVMAGRLIGCETYRDGGTQIFFVQVWSCKTQKWCILKQAVGKLATILTFTFWMDPKDKRVSGHK